MESSAGGGAAKRRHQSSAGGSGGMSFNKPPPPHLKLSSISETAFRLLCPASKSRAIIGKGGAVVRHLRDLTGARIRVLDPVPAVPELVIVLILAASSPKKRLDALDLDLGEEEVSPAQEALVRVFERVIKGEEEGEGVGNEEEKEIQGMVVCKLLAPSSQVGCVLGKGGKIVERIRQDSGAQVRVLAHEQVPACAQPGDELIHITGTFPAVKRALVSISSCLQDNPRAEAANIATVKQYGATFRGTGPPASEPFSPSPRGYIPSPNTPDYHARGFSTNLGIDITSSSHRNVSEEEVMFRILCLNDRVGSIIGKGGVIVRGLQSETGASIKVVEPVFDSDERVIIISARESSELKHSPAQDAVLSVHARLADAEKGTAVTARLLVPAQQIGCLLGKGGSIIAEMRRATGASIRIFLREQVPKCAQPNDEVVQVMGSFQSVQDALLHITGRIRETIFPLTPCSSVSMTQYIPATPEILSPLLRSRNEPTSPAGYTPMGLSQGSDHNPNVSHGVHRRTFPPHGMDQLGPLGADRALFPYSGETALHPSFDRSSSPRSWASQSGTPRGIPDTGSFSSVVGSGSQKAFPTNTTINVAVPKQLLQYVYGEDGRNLTDIREVFQILFTIFHEKVSGANVTIQDPKPEAGEGMVTITGTPHQTRTAQALLHAFILSEKTSSHP